MPVPRLIHNSLIQHLGLQQCVSCVSKNNYQTYSTPRPYKSAFRIATGGPRLPGTSHALPCRMVLVDPADVLLFSSVRPADAIVVWWRGVVRVRGVFAGERGCRSVLRSFREEAPSHQDGVQRVHRNVTRVREVTFRIMAANTTAVTTWELLRSIN